MRNVIANVGGSIGWAGIGVAHLRVADRVRNRRLGQARDRHDIPGETFLDRLAFEPAERQNLGHATLLDQIAIAIEHLDGLIGRTAPERMRPVTRRPR